MNSKTTLESLINRAKLLDFLGNAYNLRIVDFSDGRPPSYRDIQNAIRFVSELSDRHIELLNNVCVCEEAEIRFEWRCKEPKVWLEVGISDGVSYAFVSDNNEGDWDHYRIYDSDSVINLDLRELLDSALRLVTTNGVENGS